MVELPTGAAIAVAAGGSAVVLLLSAVVIRMVRPGPGRTIAVECRYRSGADGARTPAGPGLGLAIASPVAGCHGGRVLVASTEGAGSTFTRRLPAGQDWPGGPAPDEVP